MYPDVGGQHRGRAVRSGVRGSSRVWHMNVNELAPGTLVQAAAFALGILAEGELRGFLWACIRSVT